MIRVDLEGYGQTWTLNTPDPGFIGPWLMSMFKGYEIPRRGGSGIPVRFQVTISGEPGR